MLLALNHTGACTYLDQALKNAQQHHVLETRLGRDGQQHVQEGARCYGRPEHPIGRIPGRQKAAGNLGYDVAPKEGRVDHADRFRCPVELWLGLRRLMSGMV